MNAGDRDLKAEKNQCELKEMVAYVLNSNPNEDMVEMITDRLAKKVYTNDFNVFVSDKHELTANYAHEVRNK